MTDTELKAIADDEKKRITAILKEAETSQRRMETLKPIIKNVSWMKAKLDDAMEKIKATSVAIPYDNGGGQTGIRENPLFKGYESLWKSYLQGMDRILNALPPEIPVETKAEEPERPKTVLELVRAKREAK